jgi:phosphoglycerate dehydrogenase-like enzyme
VLDVYVGEFEHTPAARLWSDPRVLIAPHISAASDQDRHGRIDFFETTSAPISTTGRCA